MGLLNQILSFLLGANIDVAWLDYDMTIIVVAAIHGWKRMGLSMLIFLAGLKETIDSDVIEAAAIDGATRRQTFWRIKFPLLAPAFHSFNVATSLLGSERFDIQATNAGRSWKHYRNLHLENIRPRISISP